MTAATADISRPRSSLKNRGEAPAVWGLDAQQLHDRFWAAHGVQVVRRGVGKIERSGPSMYLLLDSAELILFDLLDAVRHLPRRQPNALRVHVIEADTPQYTERVVTDESNELIAIRRQYAPRTRSELHVLVTSDPRLALLWHRSPARRAGWRAMRRAAGLNGHRQTSCSGQIFDATDPALAHQCILALAIHWRNINTVCPHVAPHQAGVWAHHSATIDPDARIVPPVWIGAGTTLRSNDIVVGPWIVHDQATVKTTDAPVAWPPLQTPYKPAATTSLDLRRWRFGRRLFDIVFSIAALFITAPLFPLIMFAIWLEDGRPFFFTHIRQTLGGRDFVCYKFRSMCKNAEKLKAQLADKNVCDGPQFHIENDPRLLRIGRFMRRFHLDELPQFFNVLLGQMAVIGPRPSPDDENQCCPAWREARLSLKPGVTGLWQVSRTRAPNTDFQEWVRYDLDHAQRQGWRLDLWIIYKTTENILLRMCHRNGQRPRHRRKANIRSHEASSVNAAPIVGTTGRSRIEPAIPGSTLNTSASGDHPTRAAA